MAISEGCFSLAKVPKLTPLDNQTLFHVLVKLDSVILLPEDFLRLLIIPTETIKKLRKILFPGTVES